MRTLHKERPALRFACCEWMVEPLVKAGVSKNNIDVCRENTAFSYLSLCDISPVNLYHDVPNCGWQIWFWHGFDMESVFYATDTSGLDGIKMPGFDYYLIEANYTEADIAQRIASKLETGQYCYESRARECHMSKEQAISWLAENMGPNSKYMFLHQHREET